MDTLFTAQTPPLSDRARFAAAFEAHHRRVHAAAYRVLGDSARAQDVVQDVFVRLWRNPAGFDPVRGDLHTYLGMMARSRALDVIRETQARDRAGDRLELVTERREEPVDGRPEAATERRQAAGMVRDALKRLPPAQREALVLAYWGGLTADQVARHADVPLGTAKSRIRLGLTKLREECGEVLAAAAA